VHARAKNCRRGCLLVPSRFLGSGARNKVRYWHCGWWRLYAGGRLAESGSLVKLLLRGREGRRGVIRYANGRLSSTRVGKTDGERPPVNYPTDCSVLPLHFQPPPDFLQFLLTLHISEPFFSDEFISQIGRGVSITCS
jgi:hypothetical protein